MRQAPASPTDEGTAHDDAGREESGLARVSAVGFDLDGTVYLGSTLLPGALELLAALEAAGVPFVFATNNSSKSASRYLERLQELGLPAHRSTLLTSNDVAIAHLRRAGLTRPYLVATPEVVDEYRAQGIEPSDSSVDSVLLTFDTTLTYEKLRRASDLVRHGLPYLATHPDLVCPTPEGPIPDCGAFIALLAEATGRRPEVLGKPHAPMAQALAERLAVPPGRVAYVGDRLYTDIRMANENGFLAVLTLTGEASAADLADSPHRPDLVVETLTQLRDALRRQGLIR